MTLSPKRYPNLAKSGYSEDSCDTTKYNCVAWAAGDDTAWWDPTPSPFYYWPRRVPRALTVDAFIKLYEHLGYSECELRKREKDHEKIAIYALGDQFKHVARQLKTGRWTSKIGSNIDILHTLNGLEGPFYGTVAIIMKRKL